MSTKLQSLFVGAFLVVAVIIISSLGTTTSNRGHEPQNSSHPAWLCSKPSWCNYMLVDVQTRDEEKDFGYAAWVNNMIAVLELLRIPIEFTTSLNRTGQSCANFIHNLFPWEVPTFAQRIGVDVNESLGKVDFWIGPFSLNTVANLAPQFASLPDSIATRTHVHLLAESAGHMHRCGITAEKDKANISLECLLLPMGISASRYSPPKANRTDKVLPVIYLKTYGGDIIPEKEIFEMLANCSVFTYTVLRTAREGPMKFTKRQYFDALADAPWMLAFTPGDNLATFLQEARSMDVPVFLIAGDKPHWFPPSAGEFVQWRGGSPWIEHTKALSRFISEIAPSLHPREELVRTLSHEMIATKLCVELQKSWSRTV